MNWTSGSDAAAAGSGIGLLGFIAVAALALACTSAAVSTEHLQSDPSAESNADGTVAARIGDKTISLGDVDSKAMSTNMDAYQNLYNARRAALEELVAEMLMEAEAKTRNQSVEELEEQEIIQKIQPVTDEAIEQFFNENRARIPQPLETASGQIREYLEAMGENEARVAFIESLKENAAVTVSLEVPRVPIQVASLEPMKGGAEAKVTIVEYSDFQ